MRILVYGAGVLGSNLAHYLSKGNDVTILARGETYQNIQRNGLCIKHKFGGTTIDHFSFIDHLQSQDFYDVIFVVVRFSQMESILPILKTNTSKNIVFVGNNMNAEQYEHILDKNIFFAFFSAAGKKINNHIESICLKKITIGRCDGKNDSDEFLYSIFQNTKIKVTIENKMNDYLKSHACAVLPLVFACYKVDGNLKKLKRDKTYSLQIMDAIVEGYNVLRKCGFEILPQGEYENCTQKKNLCAWLYRFMFSNFIGQLCISDHAMHARDEFEQLDRAFLKLKEQSGVPTKTYDLLRKDFVIKK